MSLIRIGCDSGFGHNLAKRLDSEGFRVFASCLFSSGDGAKDLQKTCSNSLQILCLDVTKDESIKEALLYVKQHLNGSTRNSVQSLSAYSMSKFAASCFCECLRQEMHPSGVKVITIEPDSFRTSFAIWEVMESRMDALIENFDEVSKEDYGEYYFEAYKKFVKRIMLHSSSYIHKVVDCLEDAVILEEPCHVYRPRGNIFYRLIFGIVESLPKPLFELKPKIADILSCYVTHMLVPKPKKAEQRF